MDPYGGTATVGAAAIPRGRFYQGSEADPDTHASGADRLREVTAAPLLPLFSPPHKVDQGELW